MGGHWGLWNNARQTYPVIANLNQVVPKYMYSENPDLASTSARPRLASRAYPGASVLGAPVDALGRAVRALSARQRAMGAVLLAR